MSFREYIANKFFRSTIEEKVEAGIEERRLAASVTDGDEDEGWRRLTGDTPKRNLDGLKQERMIQIAFWLWENNPMAKWLLDITVDFVLADGLPYECKNDKVKEVLDDFWFDPINRMDLRIKKYAREFRMYGELGLTSFVGENSGKTRLGYVDPSQIKEAKTDPHNVAVVIGLILKDIAGKPGRKIKVILPEGADDVLSKEALLLRESYTDGECYFFATNNVTNSPRGRSDLLPVADWLDAYEQFLFDYADKWPLLNSFVWDLMVEGADEKEIKTQVKAFTKKSGSVFGHNEKVTLTASSPKLQALDAEKGARLFRNHILGSFGYPEHWYGGGGDVNRATAVEMGTPAYKTLASKQKEFKYVLEFILGTVIERARDASTLHVTDEEAKAFSITTPELASKDLTKYSTVVRDIANSMMQAELQGWIDKVSAAKVFAQTMAFIGVDLDYEEMKDEIEKEKDESGWDDYQNKDGKKVKKGKKENAP